MEMLDQSVVGAAKSIADRWRPEQAERQARRNRDRADFAELGEAGFWRWPSQRTWAGCGAMCRRRSVRCATRCAGSPPRDPSVALVVVDAPGGDRLLAGEPRPGAAGMGGPAATRCSPAQPPASSGARSRPSPAAAATSAARTRGRRHPTTEPRPPRARLHGHRRQALRQRVGRHRPHDDDRRPRGRGRTRRSSCSTCATGRGTARPGCTLIAEWDGMGMAATQSHAMRLEGVPGGPPGLDGPLEPITRAAGSARLDRCSPPSCSACSTRRSARRGEQLAAKVDQLRAFEQVEWARAEQDHWLAVQAYEGALRARSRRRPGRRRSTPRCGPRRRSPSSPRTRCAASPGCSAAARSRRRSPFAHWFEDVRALGFLRPPWGLAYDGLFATSFPPPGLASLPTEPTTDAAGSTSAAASSVVDAAPHPRGELTHSCARRRGRREPAGDLAAAHHHRSGVRLLRAARRCRRGRRSAARRPPGWRRPPGGRRRGTPSRRTSAARAHRPRRGPSAPRESGRRARRRTLRRAPAGGGEVAGVGEQPFPDAAVGIGTVTHSRNTRPFGANSSPVPSAIIRPPARAAA